MENFHKVFLASLTNFSEAVSRKFLKNPPLCFLYIYNTLHQKNSKCVEKSNLKIKFLVQKLSLNSLFKFSQVYFEDCKKLGLTALNTWKQKLFANSQFFNSGSLHPPPPILYWNNVFVIIEEGDIGLFLTLVPKVLNVFLFVNLATLGTFITFLNYSIKYPNVLTANLI